MQNARGITANQSGLALALGGITFGSIPPGLEAVGYPLGPTGGYILLSLATLCGIGAMGAFWPLLNAAWLWLRREAELQRLDTELQEAKGARDQWHKHFEEKQSEAQELNVVRERQLEKIREAEQERKELKQENEELIAESENHPDPLPDTLTEWLQTTPLITVPNQTYRNDRIELDGFHYDRCVFEDCTFSFRGTKPFRVAESCRVNGVVGIDARGPQAQAMLVFMKQLGALHPNSEWYDLHDGRRLSEDTPEQTTEVPSASESRPSDEALKQRSLRLSKELNQFLKSRAEQDPQAGVFSKEARLHHQETISQYSEHFAGPVGGLFGDLEVRGWCDSKERKQFENPIMVLSIQHISNRLAGIGHKS